MVKISQIGKFYVTFEKGKENPYCVKCYYVNKEFKRFKTQLEAHNYAEYLHDKTKDMILYNLLEYLLSLKSDVSKLNYVSVEKKVC